MKVKQVNIVSREEIEDLALALNNSIYAITNDNNEHALWILKRLRDNLESNLKEGYKAERGFRIHDKVEIISTDDEGLNGYIGKVGWIVDIREKREYPYEIEFEDKEISGDWLWKVENLKLI